MEQNIDIELLLKFISGSVSSEEREKVLEWINANEENRKQYCQLKNYWVLERYKTFQQETPTTITNKKGTNKKIIRYVIEIAAVLLVLIAPAIFYLTHYTRKPVIPPQKIAQFEYVVHSGVKGMVELPDGSKVWLNSSSSLKCPQKFDSLQRVVEIEGEGYFEVVPNKNWPMYVKTYKGYGVKVTGTTFNISSYANENKLIVTLISGNISLVREKDQSEIKLTPAEQITIVEDEKPLLVRKANIEYNTAWKKGFLLFENTPLDEVIRKMERWYGVTISVKDSSILSYRFTANFKSESVSRVLEILKLSSNIDYKIDKNKITLKN